jgi:hypothetical protein
MEVVPDSVGRAARAWDEQHGALGAAADRLGEAPTSGFTGAVAETAARFATTWQRQAAALVDRAEAEADSLRSSIADYERTDTAVANDHGALGAVVREIL